MGGENLVIEPCIKGFYEEGTWVPIVAGATGEKTPSTDNYGWFIRVGNLVSIGGTVNWNSTDALSGNIRIKGLPYRSASISNARSAIIFGVSNSGITTGAGHNVIRLVLDPGDQFIYITQSNEYRSTIVTYDHTPGISDSGIIYGIGGTYRI
jgi:hypothetical protein